VERWQLPLRAVALLGFVLIVWVMILFQSRGQILALGVGIAASVVHRRLRPAQALTGALLAGAALCIFSQTPAFEVFMKRFQEKNFGSDNPRLRQSGEALAYYLAEEPAAWLVGMGANAVDKTVGESPHNTWVRILAEQGILGVGLLAGIVAVSIRRAWRSEGAPQNLRFAILVFLVAGSMSVEPHFTVIFWICLALSAPVSSSDLVMQRNRMPSQEWAPGIV
jgi:O-antigen ligase